MENAKVWSHLLWNIGHEVMALVYFAGLLEVRPRMKYQLATIIRT